MCQPKHQRASGYVLEAECLFVSWSFSRVVQNKILFLTPCSKTYVGCLVFDMLYEGLYNLEYGLLQKSDQEYFCSTKGQGRPVLKATDWRVATLLFPSVYVHLSSSKW